MKITFFIFALIFAGAAFYYKANYEVWRDNYDLLIEQYNSGPSVMYWSKSGRTPDGCAIEYSWKEIEGDTCCLDVVYY